MFGSDVTSHVRHPRLVDEFDKFAAKERESLESVYERLTTLVNIMDCSNVRPIPMSINTKLLNFLQPEWSKYVIMKPRVRDAKYFKEQMLLAVKDEAGSNLNNEENDFMLDTLYGEETIEELTAAVMLMDRIQPAAGNAETVPSYDAKADSEVNASSKNLKELKEELTEEVQEMLNIFESMKQKVDEKSSKENILQHEIVRFLKILLLKKEKISDLNIKSFNSIKATQTQNQKELDALIEHVNQKTYAYTDVHAQNQDLLITISKLKNKLRIVDKGKNVNTKFNESETLGTLLYVTPLPKNIAVKAKKVSNTKVDSKNLLDRVSSSKRRIFQYDVLDSPCLLVLITETSQSRQHVITSLIHIESCKSPTKSLFDVGSSRISIFTVNTCVSLGCSGKFSRKICRTLLYQMLLYGEPQVLYMDCVQMRFIIDLLLALDSICALLVLVIRGWS
nr:hypothetical protein [Tanacetum cinerariifolium]